MLDELAPRRGSVDWYIDRIVYPVLNSVGGALSGCALVYAWFLLRTIST
jgi:hypothetical protein